MNVRAALLRIVLQEDVNFLLTNRIPRRFATRLMGYWSRIENPLICRLSLALWRLFADLDLSDAKKTHFTSLHDCFTRELEEGARPIAPDAAVLVSPCDAIVGAHGKVEGTRLIQAKGFPFTLRDLLHDPQLESRYCDGQYVTLRLTSAMYHRFHAPHAGRLERVTYIAGDTWNVNPIALRRVERLFCKNERAVLRLRLAAGDHLVTMVPVAAILVASIRLHALDLTLNEHYGGARTIQCGTVFAKGQEMGWFEHGSTIIVFAPPGFTLAPGVHEGARVRMGEPLLHLPP
jgi:phosphatidylserine decarboxylase